MRLSGLICTIIPIVLGGVLYYFIAPDVRFVSMINNMLGNRYTWRLTNIPVLPFFRNYIFDFLWGISLAGFIRSIFEDVNGVKLSFCVTILLGGCLEFFQGINMLAGTADFFDVIAELAGAAVTNIIMRRCKQ